MKGKNIFSLLLFCATALLTVTSCGDDDEPVASPQGIVIVKSDLLFDPQGRTGSVELQNSGTITAETSAPWAVATVQGNIISVAVEDNASFEGRTALLTIQADGDQRQLPIQQRGMALGSLAVDAYHATNTGGRVAFYIRHDLPLNITVDEDWVHASTEGDSMIINIEPNTGRVIRRALLTYECGGFANELAISQYNMNDVIGEYYLGGEMSGTQTGMRFYLVQRDGRYYMNFYTSSTWKNEYVPVDFNEERCEITIHSATVIYEENASRYDAFYLYSRTASGITLAASEQATMTARIYYNPIWGTHYGSLEGTYGSAQLTGFIIRVTYPIVGTSTLIQFDDPYLVFLGPAPN